MEAFGFAAGMVFVGVVAGLRVACFGAGFLAVVDMAAS